MDENVKISIEGEGLALTKMTTLQKAGQIISFLGYNQDSMGMDSTSTPSGVGAPLLPTNKKLQPREMIVSSNAKTYAQKIAVLAKYLMEQLGQNTFTPQELKLLFKKMGDEPKNFTRDMKTALESQYVLCIDSASDQYELTDKGADAVNEGFIGIVVKKNSGNKKTVVSKGIRDEIRSMEIRGDMDGYPDYHKLPTKGDKILWLLEYAFKKDVKALTPAEVDALSVKLRDRVESGGFAALNARNVKNSYVMKTAEGFQIQKRGSDYLSSLNNEN